jgi:hypothetical protein
VVEVISEGTGEVGTAGGIKTIHGTFIDNEYRMALSYKGAATPRQQGLGHEIVHVDGQPRKCI